MIQFQPFLSHHTMDIIVEHIKARLIKEPKEDLHLPIKTICKIPVSVFVCNHYLAGYMLNICAQRCHHTYYCEPVLLEELKGTLSSLQYNASSSRFQTTPIIDWSCLQSENVEMEFTECCVCLLYTNAITDCRHAVCYACYDQIKLVGDETPCPLCRKDVTYVSY